MDSHKQLPRFALSRFKDHNGAVFILCLKDFQIYSRGPRVIGTEQDYYSPAMEDYLSTNRENPFCRATEKFIEFAEQKKTATTINPNDEVVTKRYVTSSMARSNRAFNSFMQNSITAQLFIPQSNHDHLVYFASERNNGISELIENYKILIMVNKTQHQFVLPRNCIYGISSFGFFCIIVPLSPFCALQLVPPEFDKNYIDGQETRLVICNDPEMVLLMNIAAMRYEYVFNRDFVAAGRKKELEELKSYAVANKSSLDDFSKAINSDLQE